MDGVEPAGGADGLDRRQPRSRTTSTVFPQLVSRGPVGLPGSQNTCMASPPGLVNRVATRTVPPWVGVRRVAGADGAAAEVVGKVAVGGGWSRGTPVVSATNRSMVAGVTPNPFVRRASPPDEVPDGTAMNMVRPSDRGRVQ